MHPLFLILSPSNCCPVENAPIYAHPYITLSEKFSSSVHIAMHCCPAENADTVVEWKYAQLSVRWVYLLLTGHNLPPLSLLPQLYPNPCSIPSADNCQFQQLSHNVYFSVQERTSTITIRVDAPSFEFECLFHARRLLGVRSRFATCRLELLPISYLCLPETHFSVHLVPTPGHPCAPKVYLWHQALIPAT